MPKSKRNKQVTLSKTKKKGREHKEGVVNGIREAVEGYSSIYVFSFENMRNLKFREFRQQLKPTSRFFLGSNKVMQIALGRSAADEIQPGIHKVSKLLRGDAGLFLTNMPKEEVESFFSKYEYYDFARTGSIATEKVELPEGPLEQFTHEMEPFLRKQGMPVRLNKGVIELVSDYVDRTAVVTTNAETKALSPPGIQEAIDVETVKYPQGRCFIRPSSTEDVIRVYAEASTQKDADSLANSVAKIADKFLGFSNSNKQTQPEQSSQTTCLSNFATSTI